MDELISSSHHHQHSTMASSHHSHKIERTSIRTYYSNMDVSKQRSSRQQLFQQQQQQPLQPYAPELLPRYAQHNVNPYAVPLTQSNMPVQHVARQQQQILRGGNNYDYELDRYVDVVNDELGVDGDYEDDDCGYQRMRPLARRATFMPHATGRRNHTTSMMSQIPGQRKYAYDELTLPDAGLQTAKARMQHAPTLPQQQQQPPLAPQMRIRSPSLPIIRHQDYIKRQAPQQRMAGGMPQQKMPPQATQLAPAAVCAIGIPVGAPSNAPHRSNNPNNPVNPGCQEEDTSGYRSDSPKNPHTPEIWYNDAASLQRSGSSTTNSGLLGADGSGVEVGAVPVAVGVGGVVEGANELARRAKHAITGQQLAKCQKQQQMQQYACDEVQQQQQQQQLMNSTYVVARSYNSGMDDSCQGR